jgi:hypothetical protein
MRVNTDTVGTSSHLPVLQWACSQTRGPVLEFGGGLYSTAYLESLDRETCTIEAEPAWQQELRERWPDHHIEPALTRRLLEHYWGVVLIDHGIGEWAWIDERAAALQQVRGFCEVALVHDWHIGPGHREDTVNAYSFHAWFAPDDGTMHTAMASDVLDVTHAVIPGGRVYTASDAPKDYPN